MFHSATRLAVWAAICGMTFLSVSGDSATAQNADDVQQRELLQLIRDTEELLAAGNWLQAAAQFDTGWERVSRGEDPLLTLRSVELPPPPAGAPDLPAGGRARLERLFRTAPEPFRIEYRRQYAAAADQLLANALRTGELADLRQVASRYRFLAAAETAVRAIVRISLDRGESLETALQLEHLLQITDRPSAELKLQLAAAAQKAGLEADARETARAVLEHHAGETITLRGQSHVLPTAADDPLASLALLAQIAGPEDRVRDDIRWIQPLGNQRRLGRQRPGPVGFRTAWKSDLFTVNDILLQDELNPILSGLQRDVQQKAVLEIAGNRTVIPTAGPLVQGELAVFRTVAGLRAVSLSTGDLVWESNHVDVRLRDLRTLSPAGRGESMPPGGPGAGDLLRAGAAWQLFLQLHRTNPAGQLSSDGQTIYAVEDSSAVTWGDRSHDFRLMSAEPAPAGNFLRAYDAESGVFLWEADGLEDSQRRGDPRAAVYFLGAPLVLGARLYVLAESGEGIFLLQLGRPDGTASGRVTGNPRILGRQLLTVPGYSLREHPVRMHSGLMPSYAHGLLICPTSDARIVAVSTADHSLRWEYRYPDKLRIPELGGPRPVLNGARDPFEAVGVDLDARWTDSLPRIVDGRVLYTPRDADELFCLDLQTGRELWRSPRGMARSLAAVTRDTVVLQGIRGIQALRLDDGGLLWSTEITQGNITGQAASDERVVQVPTSAPAIESFEIATGRRLLTQALPRETLPGNLLVVGDRMLSQNLVTLTCLTAAPQTGQPSDLIAAQQLLLSGSTEKAVQLMETRVPDEVPGDQPPGESGSEAAAETEFGETSEIRELLIETLLESLRLDFAGYSQRIPQVRRLIHQTRVGHDPVRDLFEGLLGMNLNDLAVLPERLESLDDSGRKLDRLFELIVKSLYENRSAALPQVTNSIGSLLTEFAAGRGRQIASGYLSRRNSQLLAAGIRKVVRSRFPDDQLTLQDGLKTALDEMLRSREESAEQRARLIRDLDASGLDRMALQVLESGPRETTPETPVWAPLQAEQLRLAAVRDGNEDSPRILNSLLTEWHTAGNPSAVRALLEDLSSPDAGDPAAAMQFRSSDPARALEGVEQFLEQYPEYQQPAPAIWAASPKVTESADTSMQPAGRVTVAGPAAVLPLFGMPGVFRGWTFFEDTGSPAVVAIDSAGVRRWAFDPGQRVATRPAGLVSDRYVMACGHLVAIKRHEMIYLLDASAATPESPPRVLWQTDVSALHHDLETQLSREVIPTWERIQNYAPQPAGFYPCGPLSPRALPVIAGKRLFVFDPLTGDTLWQVEGVPADAVLLGTEETVLILSERETQVEIRSLTDGEQLSVVRLPAWWTAAAENVGASVRDIEVEPGMEILWRIAVHGQNVVLFCLGSEKCRLECRDLVNDQTVWNLDLPQNSVFSNVTEDLVAILSNGQTLQLCRIDTGRQVASLDVTPIPDPRELYLRRSLNRLIVLPEAVEDPSFETIPIISGMPVHGRMYAIDRDTMQLAWDQPLNHRHIRILNAPEGPTLPNAPVLVLLSRTQIVKENGARPTRAGVQVVDVQTGQDVYVSDDVGMGFNSHWLLIDAAQQRLELSFERRTVTLDYRQP